MFILEFVVLRLNFCVEVECCMWVGLHVGGVARGWGCKIANPLAVPCASCFETRSRARSFSLCQRMLRNLRKFV
ncbi:hypothetical protein KC19_VG062500 [Ceratodon purpureus]|uniref:Secreted protein n=1 Tax=Ceratodon purpureus TaxID=3225 RepID=A0A8T0HMH2_CERPU|nr:hypothetical protein KC19_VG062500 [Ceratodon purpureus]